MNTAQITAPHFVAGLILEDLKVVRAAPIVKYMVGWDWPKVIHYCDYRGWKAGLI